MTNSQKDGLQAAKNLLMYRHAIYAALDYRPETQRGVERLLKKIADALAPNDPEPDKD